MGGEAYHNSAYDYMFKNILNCNTHFSTKLMPYESDIRNNTLHLIDGYPKRLIGLRPQFLQKIRVIYSWGNWDGTMATGGRTKKRLITSKKLLKVNSKIAWTVYEDMYATFVPYFVHSSMFTTQHVSKRKKSILLLGKKCTYVEHLKYVMNEFEVYSLNGCQSTRALTNTRNLMRPLEFTRTLSQFQFLLGVGNPAWSPTPYEAIANGVTVVMPYDQHPFVQRLGAPFAYSYTNVSELLKILRDAPGHHGYIPYNYTLYGASLMLRKAVAGILDIGSVMS